MPVQASAIVMLDSPGNTLSDALCVAHQHRASFLVISPGHTSIRLPLPCARGAGEAGLLQSQVGHDQGEAEFVGQLARKCHWHSIAVVAITPRARVPVCGYNAASSARSTW
jgi:hypothetical protein